MDDVISEFRTKCGVPKCFNAVDGCHIPICAPNEQHTDHYNRRVVFNDCSRTYGCKLPFFDVCIGWPGSLHDARVFAHSNLYKKIAQGHLALQPVLECVFKFIS